MLFSSIEERTSLLLISLSIADFLICSVIHPLLTFRFNLPDQSQSFQFVQRFLSYCLFAASFSGLVICDLRFVAVYFP